MMNKISDSTRDFLGQAEQARENFEAYRARFAYHLSEELVMRLIADKDVKWFLDSAWYEYYTRLPAEWIDFFLSQSIIQERYVYRLLDNRYVAFVFDKGYIRLIGDMKRVEALFREHRGTND